MPEGDSIRRAARRLQPLVGERVNVETPHPQAAAKRLAERLDGRRLLAVEPLGKNLVLRFEGGLALRSHLRMRGRWQVVARGTRRRGRPWLVLRGREQEAALWNGPVLELDGRALARVGPDILADEPNFDAMVRGFRATEGGRALGDALLDQRLVAGIGNLWRAEALWHAGISPRRSLRAVTDEELRAVLRHAARLMRASVEGGREERRVYRRRVCARCRGRISAEGLGDANRTAYWCPACQR